MVSKAKKGPKLSDVNQIIAIFDKLVRLLKPMVNDIITFSKDTAHNIILRLHGKQIAVLGPAAAGKTTLLHVLADPNTVIDPVTYEKTTDAVVFDDKITINWKIPLNNDNKETIHLKIRKPKDVGGEISFRDSQDGWIDVCTKSDFIFYLFDSTKYLNGDSTQINNRLKDDFEWIANNAQGFTSGFKIVVFANKIDKIIEDTAKYELFKGNCIPEITTLLKDALGPYSEHLSFITPCSLLSNKTRTNAISLALKELAER